MDFPEFFDKAPTITFHDPLAVFLGASDGAITYHYADAVRLAGHSCPTVAGTYLMVLNGLAALYGNDTPERGNIEVYMQGDSGEGTTGVMANVAMLLTGAAPETGFGGLGGRFSRRDLLHYNARIPGIMALRRRDTGKGVVLDLDAGVVPPQPQMRALMMKAMSGEASAQEQAQFGALWQERVRRMLLEHATDQQMIHVRELS